MKPTTVWGCATQIGGIAAEHDRLGRVVAGHSYRELSLELGDGLVVDLAHDHEPRGELVYGEVARDDRVNCVAVMEIDADVFDQLEEPIYFSPELLMIGDVDKRSYIARTAELLSLGLTSSPATLGALPLQWRRGDVRSRLDRGGWSALWRSNDQLLARCVDHLHGPRLSEFRARHLVDMRRADGPPMTYSERAAFSSWRALPNGLERSACVGKVLRVS